MIEYLRIMIAARTEKLGERGASAVEYALLIAGIAALIVAVVGLLGGQVRDSFNGTCGAISNGGTAPATCN
jgi:pilus assembly protein Flp/PilA